MGSSISLFDLSRSQDNELNQSRPDNLQVSGRFCHIFLYQLKQNVENALVVIVKDVVSQGAVLGSVSETQHIVLQHGLKTFAKGEGAVNEAGAEEAIDDGQIGADDIVAVGRSVIDNERSHLPEFS